MYTWRAVLGIFVCVILGYALFFAVAIAGAHLLGAPWP